MIKNVNLCGTYSGHTLSFPDGREITDLSPGIRGTAAFVVTQVENDGNFELPRSLFVEGEPKFATCRITGHYKDRESQDVCIYCSDVNPLLGIDKSPDRQPVTVGESEFQAAKKLLESAGYIVESRKTFDTFIDYLNQNGGLAPMDDGKYFLVVRRLNEDNFDFTKYPKFLEQIKAEGIYDRCYVAVIADPSYIKNGKLPVDLLPIFGRYDKYVTDWLRNPTISDAVHDLMRERRIGLKRRLDYFKIPESETLHLSDLKKLLWDADMPAGIGRSRKGDYLETNLDFTKTECDKWHEIPSSGGTVIVWLKNNKFVIDRKRFTSADKALEYLKSMSDSRSNS